MAKRTGKTEAQLRAANARRQRELRARRHKAGQCIRCGDPVHIHPDGSASSECRKHLDADARRKHEATPLPGYPLLTVDEPAAEPPAWDGRRAVWRAEFDRDA